MAVVNKPDFREILITCPATGVANVSAEVVAAGVIDVSAKLVVPGAVAAGVANV